MKTPIKLIISTLSLALAVSVSSPTRANDTPSSNKAFAAVVYPAANGTKLWLGLEKYQSENRITLQLVNQNGTVLFQETVAGKNSKQHAYRQQFDMSELKDGNYTFRIASGNQREELSFKLETPTVEVTQPIRLIAIK